MSLPQHPGARAFHRMVFDKSRGYTLLYGGLPTGTNADALSDTWVLNSGASSWKRLNPAANPGPLNQFAMAYDESRGVTVIFGGQDDTGTVLGETWEWDGVNWTEHATGGTAGVDKPAARRGCNMFYDSVLARVVLFGGTAGGDPSALGTWAWDGSDWEDLAPSTQPTAVAFHGMCYYTSRNEGYLFGGWFGSAAYSNQLWRWDSATEEWSQLMGLTSVSLAQHVDLVYHETEDKIYHVSGQPAETNPDLVDNLVEYNGTDRTVITTAGGLQRPYTSAYGLAYDSVADRILLHGGRTSDTSDTDMISGTWILEI